MPVRIPSFVKLVFLNLFTFRVVPFFTLGLCPCKITKTLAHTLNFNKEKLIMKFKNMKFWFSIPPKD